MTVEERKNELRKKLKIPGRYLKEINAFFLDPHNRVVDEMLEVVLKYGSPSEINKKAKKAQKLSFRLKRLREAGSPFLKDLRWLIRARKRQLFISVRDYRRKILGDRADSMDFKQDYAVTLEISAFQFFEWLRIEAQQAIDNGEIMPGRYIRVRSMKDQLEGLEPVAVGAAMDVIGANYVETLDTKGTDGSNIHLGGPETITGYFGGVGQPNDYALKWLDEYLRYYVEFGIRQVLNVNAGTILLALFLNKMGIDAEFKISVYMGIDNPYNFLSTMIMAKLFSRSKGRTSLVGLNFSNSVNNETIEIADGIRKYFGFEDSVRFEHHIVETRKSIVIQPYDRREELLEIASKVKNISAKHEGGDVEVEDTREHPSDILDYFIPKKEVKEKNLWNAMLRNFLDKHNAVNHTARALTEKGLSFIGARNLHY